MTPCSNTRARMTRCRRLKCIKCRMHLAVYACLQQAYYFGFTIAECLHDCQICSCWWHMAVSHLCIAAGSAAGVVAHLGHQGSSTLDPLDVTSVTCVGSNTHHGLKPRALQASQVAVVPLCCYCFRASYTEAGTHAYACSHFARGEAYDRKDRGAGHPR
jgi:hypothetical protein